MARPTKTAEDRKRCYSVTLTPRQKEEFEKLGGSPWLQGVIDARRLSADPVAHASFLEGWRYNPETRTWSPK